LDADLFVRQTPPNHSGWWTEEAVSFQLGMITRFHRNQVCLDQNRCEHEIDSRQCDMNPNTHNFLKGLP
jgi:hypothetical protein